MQVGLDRGQRHIHDGGVQHNHQFAHAQQDQRGPALGVFNVLAHRMAAHLTFTDGFEFGKACFKVFANHFVQI